MDNYQIETAQNVHLAQNTANLGDRSIAYLLDVLIIFAYQLLMLFVLLLFGGNIERINLAALITVLGLPAFLYHLLMETFNNGQSIGKAAMRIRVVKLDGGQPQFSNYLIRWLLRIIDFGITSGGVAIITYLLNGKGQRLGDIAAKTTVISEKQNRSVQQTLMTDIPEDYIPQYPQVTVFSDREMEKIKNLYRQAGKNNTPKVMYSLAAKVASMMEVAHTENAEVFLNHIIKDYNYYTRQ